MILDAQRVKKIFLLHQTASVATKDCVLVAGIRKQTRKCLSVCMRPFHLLRGRRRR